MDGSSSPEEEATVVARAVGATTGSEWGYEAYDGAFVQLYQSYYTRIFAFVYSRVGNVELAKDLSAEVFEKAYVKGHSVREAAAYTTWLFMIAKNVGIGHYRRQKRENNGLTRMKDSLWLSERPADPEVDTLRGEAVSNLMRHLRRLADRDPEPLP